MLLYYDKETKCIRVKVNLYPHLKTKNDYIKYFQLKERVVLNQLRTSQEMLGIINAQKSMESLQ